MPIRNNFKCPCCDRKLYQYEQRIPIVGQCRCGQRLRLIGESFITWPDWLRIKARIVEPSPDQKLLNAVGVIG